MGAIGAQESDLVLAAAASLALGACESGVLPAESGDVAVIRIAPEAPRVELADTLRLNASLLDATGNGPTLISTGTFMTL